MPKILVADDCEDIRELLRIKLSQLGFEIVEATNGVEAVQLTETANPDMVLMDMNMPAMDGWQACSYLRNGGNWTPIIATTAYGLPGDQARAMQAGCNAVHIKPFRFDELREQIEELLTTRPAR